MLEIHHLEAYDYDKLDVNSLRRTPQVAIYRKCEVLIMLCNLQNRHFPSGI